MSLANTFNINDIPWVELAPLILAFVVGLVLLLAGRRVMRVAFTGVGLIVGAAIGWILAQSAALPVSDWIVIIVPALVIAALASLAYKLTIAVVMAIVLGIACPLALITAGDVGLYDMPTGEAATDATDDDIETGESPALPEGLEGLELPPDVAEWLRDIAKDEASNAANEFLGIEPADAADEADAAREGEPADEGDESANGALNVAPEAQEHVDRASAFVRDVYAESRARWDSFPQSLRYNLMLSAAIGALLGLLLGALAPTMSTSVASAGAGSAVCLMTASIVAARFGAGSHEWMPNHPGTWLVLWLVVAVIGLAIQWTTRPKPVDKSR